MKKEHSKKCKTNAPKYYGDARNEFPNEVGDCNCDGYHTFDELYEHRICLWIALCNAYGLANHSNSKRVWRSKLHSDGSGFDGWFILGMNTEKGEQITYHLPIKYWDECLFEDLEKAPEFDGHTIDDVLERIKKL